MKIIKATENDLDRIIKVLWRLFENEPKDSLVFLDAWQKEFRSKILNDLQNENYAYFLLEKDNQIMWYMSWCIELNSSSEASLHGFWLHKDIRWKRGVKKLSRSFLAWMNEKSVNDLMYSSVWPDTITPDEEKTLENTHHKPGMEDIILWFQNR